MEIETHKQGQSHFHKKSLTIGEPAPDFQTMAYHNGQFKEISLKDYKGKYLVLFFYPMDFTFVCPTEILAFNQALLEFQGNNAELIGCSVDSHFVHMQWCNTPRAQGGLGQIQIPLLADVSKEISKAYNSLIKSGPNKGVTLRSTFIIDDKGVLRHMSFSDLPVGRNVEEVLRLVKAFRYTDVNGEVCPAKWRQEGDATMLPSHNATKTK